MNEELMNQYLMEVEHNLKHTTKAEKKDIIKEIKSHIEYTWLQEHMEMNTILERLGQPDELARNYAAETIINTNKHTIYNWIRTLVYYGATGVKEFVLAVLAGASYLSVGLSLLGGLIKSAGTLLGFDMQSLKFIVGMDEVPDSLAFFVSLPIAFIFYICGKKLWNYVKKSLKMSIKNVEDCGNGTFLEK